MKPMGLLKQGVQPLNGQTDITHRAVFRMHSVAVSTILRAWNRLLVDQLNSVKVWLQLLHHRVDDAVELLLIHKVKLKL